MESILIIDPDAQARWQFADTLTKAGFPCQTAEKREQADDLLAKYPFDLLLMDLDAFDESFRLAYVEELRTRYPLTALIIVSAAEDPLLARQYFHASVYGYLGKPLRRAQVRIAVESALQRNQLNMEGQLQITLLQRTVTDQTKFLEDQVHFHQRLLDAIPLPICYKNRDLIYMGCNKAFAAHLDQPHEAIIGRTSADLYPEELARQIAHKEQQILLLGGIQVYERVRGPRYGGSQITISHKAGITDDNGQICGIVGVSMDITERKAMEESLRLSKEKLRLVMDNLHTGVMMINPQLEILEINSQMQTWFTPDNSTALLDSLFQLSTGLQRAEPKDASFLDARALFHQGHSQEMTAPLSTKTMAKRIFHIIFSPIRNKQQQLTAAVGFFEDITEKLLHEREHSQSQKLESIGQMAAGIAHEINTPTQFIGSNLDFLNESFQETVGLVAVLKDILHQPAITTHNVEDIKNTIAETLEEMDWPFLQEEVPAALKQTQEGVRRITSIVRAMKEFSHPSGKEKAPVNLNKIIETTVIVARNEWKYSAEVKLELAEDLPEIMGLADELGQVFLNMLINAAHAIEAKHQAKTTGQKGLITFVSEKQDEQIQIRISDTGSGIPLELQERIFDPFFTTKPVGRGTGQGLAIAHDVIIGKHGGTIMLCSKPDQGTTFLINLPLSAPASPA